VVTAVTAPAQAVEASATPVATLLSGWHLLSLDAPSVAALWTVFFARRFNVSLPWTAPAALALAVWIFYALDRLADATHPGEALAERHRFHHRHRCAFFAAICGAIPALILLIALLPPAIRTGWLLLALPLAIYVVVVHGLRLPRVPKEHLVAIFFALATTIPVVVSHTAPAPKLIAAICLFGALCWLNCVAIARWERAQDTDAATAWAATHFGITITVILAVVALLLITVPAIGVACAISALLLLLLERTRPHALLLRSLADAALLTPLALLPFLR
jgi:hypothetical protein